MSCFRPLTAHRTDGGDVKIGPSPFLGGAYSFELPCGKCIGCRQDRARAWSIRIMHESQLHDQSLFVTLTYRSEDLPGDFSLNYRHFQLFMKRLRKRFGGVRFFCAGEYGEEYLRPHFHAVLFGLWFPDQVRLANGSFRSEVCEELWKLGDVHIGALTPERAAYIAGYANAKALRESERVLFDPATGEIWNRRREFITMSRRPGLGAEWFARFSGDLFPLDRAVTAGKCYKVPRYYFEKFKAEKPCVADEIAHRRFLKAREGLEDSSPERRAVREELAKRRERAYSKRGF